MHIYLIKISASFFKKRRRSSLQRDKCVCSKCNIRMRSEAHKNVKLYDRRFLKCKMFQQTFQSNKQTNVIVFSSNFVYVFCFLSRPFRNKFLHLILFALNTSLLVELIAVSALFHFLRRSLRFH